MPGPMPKRSTERTRRNKPENEGGITLSKGLAQGGEQFPAKRHWEKLTKDWYAAVGKSGMAEYYEQSDWAMVLIIAEELDAYYKEAAKPGGKRSAMMLATIFSAMESLGVTEGERRRMRIELEKPSEPETPASVVAIDGYRDALGLGKASGEE